MDIVHREEVDFTISSGALFVDVSISGSFTDFNQLAVMGMTHSLEQDPAEPYAEPESRAFISARFIDLGGGSYSMRFQRGATSKDAFVYPSCSGTAYVVQFGSSVNVYRGSSSMASGASSPQAVNVDINGGSPMLLNDVNKSFVMFTCLMGNGAPSFEGIDSPASSVMVKFLDTSTLEFSRYEDTMAINIEWTVIESNDIEVDHVNQTTDGTATGFLSIGVPEKEKDKLFLVISYKQVGPWFHGWRGVLRSNIRNNVEYYRTVSGPHYQFSSSEIQFQRVYDKRVRVNSAGTLGVGSHIKLSGKVVYSAFFDVNRSVVVPSVIPPERSSHGPSDFNVGTSRFHSSLVHLKFATDIRSSLDYSLEGLLSGSSPKHSYGWYNIIEFPLEGVPLFPTRSVVVT